MCRNNSQQIRTIRCPADLDGPHGEEERLRVPVPGQGAGGLCKEEHKVSEALFTVARELRVAIDPLRSNIRKGELICYFAGTVHDMESYNVAAGNLTTEQM